VSCISFRAFAGAEVLPNYEHVLTRRSEITSICACGRPRARLAKMSAKLAQDHLRNGESPATTECCAPRSVGSLGSSQFATCPSLWLGGCPPLPPRSTAWVARSQDFYRAAPQARRPCLDIVLRGTARCRCQGDKLARRPGWRDVRRTSDAPRLAACGIGFIINLPRLRLLRPLSPDPVLNPLHRASSKPQNACWELAFLRVAGRRFRWDLCMGSLTALACSGTLRHAERIG
jgi:hypothetical protein